MKFIPIAKMRGSRAKLRRKENGRFEKSFKGRIPHCPNVWGFKRWSYLSADDQFFLTDGAMWGNHDSGVERTGERKTVGTMLLGLRLLYYLGARIIYLVGVDFRMAQDRQYSWDQKKGGVTSNNEQYVILNNWLCRMQKGGVFKRFGLKVFNCYERSGLRAFPYVPFDEALEQAVGIVEEVPDLVGWYEK
jgi:hypothetical protein